MSLPEAVRTRLSEAIGRISVKSALNPILWLCGLVDIPGVPLLPFLKPIPNWFPYLLLAPPAAAVLGFLFLLAFDRGRLQSENYQLRDRVLDLIEEKGVIGVIPAEAIAVISNPELPALPALPAPQDEQDHGK